MKKIAVLLVVLALSGCKDNYGASEKAALNIGNGIAAGMKTADDLRVAGKISVQEIEGALDEIRLRLKQPDG
mgnify:CR=1 FL=1